MEMSIERNSWICVESFTLFLGPSGVHGTDKYTPASPFQWSSINRTEHNHKSCNYTHSHHQMDVLSKRNRYGLVSPAADEPIVEPASVSVCMNEFKLNLIKYACVCLLNFIWSFDVTSDVVVRQVTPQHTHTHFVTISHSHLDDSIVQFHSAFSNSLFSIYPFVVHISDAERLTLDWMRCLIQLKLFNRDDIKQIYGETVTEGRVCVCGESTRLNGVDAEAATTFRWSTRIYLHSLRFGSKTFRTAATSHLIS